MTLLMDLQTKRSGFDGAGGASSRKLPVVLGLHVGHDATASLVVEGKLVAAVGEERLSRIKQHYGFPRRGIHEVLKQAGISGQDVDCIALGGGDPLRLNPWQVAHIYQLERNGDVDFSNTVPLRVGRQACFGALGLGMKKLLGAGDNRKNHAAKAFFRCLSECGLDTEKLETVDHHLCHAVSGFSTSDFNKALALTIDGYGDGINTALWSCSPAGIKLLASGPSDEDAAAYSPGDFYSYVTRYLGYKRNRHEGKITGLAAYASPEDLFATLEDLLTLDQASACFSSSVNAFRNIRERRPWVILRRLMRWAISGRLWDPMLVDELGLRCKGFTPAQVASAAQKLLEVRVVELVKHWIQATGHTKVCLAGGVFANVKLNQRIAELPSVEDVYVHPNMGDGGLATGAALWAAGGSGDGGALVRHCLDDVFLGPEFSANQMRRALEDAGLMFVRDDCIEQTMARAIHDGKVIARFDGRMEYGPRALGNRSILAAPTDPEINHWLNERLRRTEFMPFAPAVLAESAADIFSSLPVGRTLRFMTITLDMEPEWRQKAPAVCHVDGTARPQFLDLDSTPSFHRTVSEYYRISGLPLVINTSFNIHEEPIVCTPKDAVRAFCLGHLDALALGPFWVESQPNRG